jgi:ribosomal protein S17
MENNNTCVYQHVRLDTNEVFYIGIGNNKRPYNKRHRNKWWNNIVNKTDYRVDILFDYLTWDEACEKEKQFIQLYGRKDLGIGTLVNLTDGGDGLKGRIVSDETKQKMSLVRKGKPVSEETKLKLSLCQKGRVSSRKGKPHTKRTKQKMARTIKNNRNKKNITNIYNILKNWDFETYGIINDLKISKHYPIIKTLVKQYFSKFQKYIEELNKFHIHKTISEEPTFNIDQVVESIKRKPLSKETKLKMSIAAKNRNKL